MGVQHKGKIAQVPIFPNCDICLEKHQYSSAEYDGRTVFGPWAYMCKACFFEVGIGLGIGKGQKLILRGG